MGLPSLGTFIFALGTIWNIPYVEQIVGTITAADTALAGLLGAEQEKLSGGRCGCLSQ